MTLDDLPGDRCRCAIRLLGALRRCPDEVFGVKPDNEDWLRLAVSDLRDTGFVELVISSRGDSALVWLKPADDIEQDLSE